MPPRGFRIGWRQLAGDPAYSAVALLGLALALACCILVGQLVFNEVLPDPDVPDPARVVAIEFRGNVPGERDDWVDQAPFVFGPALREAGAPVDAVARSRAVAAHLRAGARALPTDLAFVDPDMVDVFGLRAVSGDLRGALRRPDAIVLTTRTARALFPGLDDVIGRVVTLRGRALSVAAVIAHVPTSLAPVEALAGFESAANPVPADDRVEWYSMSGKVVARLSRGHSAAEVGAAAQAVFDARGVPGLPPEWSAHGRQAAFLRATPLTRQYLHGGGSDQRRLQLLGLGVGAALTLLLAAANYVNLATVRTLARVREIAVRKTLGAGPGGLAAQFVAESVLAAGLAAVAGLLLAWLAAPVLADLLWLRVEDGLFAPVRLAALAAFAAALGVVAGLYPARLAVGVRCVEALAGRPQSEGAAGRLARRAMTALQFTVALVIAAGASVVLWQNHHVQALSHGIRTEGLLAVDVPDGLSGRSDALNLAFRAAIDHEPGVDATAWSMDVPGRGADRITLDLKSGAGGALARVSAVPVGLSFFAIYGVALLAGEARVAGLDPSPRAPRDPAPDAAPIAERQVVLDTAAARALGFVPATAAVGALVSQVDRAHRESPMRVVAVAADVRLENARDAVRPHVFILSRHAESTLTLQGPRIEALRAAVARAWPRFFPDDLAEPVTVAQALDVPYRFEHRMAALAAATTLLALLLSAFGVYALAAYTVRRGAREIVVRKLYGAGRARIAGLLAREFAPLLGAAALLGLPLSAWLAQAWLAHFVERSPTAWWALPLALVALVATAALAALRHAVVAMKMRPVLVLTN